MRAWSITASVAMLLACTANDGTPRADFYPTATTCASHFDCPAGQRCYSGQCLPMVTCISAAECQGAPAPLQICRIDPGGTGECVMCVTAEDCTTRFLGNTCTPNNECTP